MRSKKPEQKIQYRGPRVWLPHSLQNLPTIQFARAIERVLKGKDELIRLVATDNMKPRKLGSDDD